MNFQCESCGQVHSEWPALAFNFPTAYHVLPDDLKNEIAEFSEDFCIINHPEQTDRFIRVVLVIPVNDHCENLEYGVWVSLSEKSFVDYISNFDNPDHEAEYFGWLCNDFPEYEIADIPTTVVAIKGDNRPHIFPHEGFEHQLVHDFYNGISKVEAEKRINDMVSGISS